MLSCVGSSVSLNVYNPFTWLYAPVNIDARLGDEMEFVQKQLSNTHPSAAKRRMFSLRAYSANRPP